MKRISLISLIFLSTWIFLNAGSSLPQNRNINYFSPSAFMIEAGFSLVFNSDTAVLAGNQSNFINFEETELSNIPILTKDKYITSSGHPVNLSILENDEVPSGYFLEIIKNPGRGTAEIEDNTITYTPSGDKKEYTDTIIYKVSSTDNSDRFSTGKAIVRVQSEEEKTSIEDFRVYPNPTSGFINVFLPGKVLMEYEVMIIDPSGQEILHKTNLYSSFPFRFNTENLSKGIYLVRILTDDESTVRKIVVN